MKVFTENLKNEPDRREKPRHYYRSRFCIEKVLPNGMYLLTERPRPSILKKGMLRFEEDEIKLPLFLRGELLCAVTAK
jgi:hypothetical protein